MTARPETNASGIYFFVSCAARNAYTLTVEAKGFSKAQEPAFSVASTTHRLTT